MGRVGENRRVREETVQDCEITFQVASWETGKFQVNHCRGWELEAQEQKRPIFSPFGRHRESP